MSCWPGPAAGAERTASAHDPAPHHERSLPMSVKLFVGGLAFSTTSEGLRAAFARFGTGGSATVMTDRATGRSRGFGFVEMTTPEEADRAISGMNGTMLD